MEQQNIKFNRLTGIRIQNFRSIKDSGKINIKDFTNIIIGKNDVGKDNILDALKLFGDPKLLIQKFFRTGANQITITLFFEISNKFDIFGTVLNIKELTDEHDELKKENKKPIKENEDTTKENERIIKENADLIWENTDIGVTKIFDKNSLTNQDFKKPGPFIIPTKPESFAFFTRKLFYKNLKTELIKKIETKIEKQFNQQEATKINKILAAHCKELSSELKNKKLDIFTEHDTNFVKELINKIGEIQTIKQLIPDSQSLIENIIYLEFIFHIKKDFDNFFSENTNISNQILKAIKELYKIEYQIKVLNITNKKFLELLTTFVNIIHAKSIGFDTVTFVEKITDVTFDEIYEDYPNSLSKLDKMNQNLKESYGNYWIKDDQFPSIRLEGYLRDKAEMKIFFKEPVIDKAELNIPEKYIEFGLEDKSAGKRAAFATWLQIESFSKTQLQEKANTFTFLILDEPTNNLHETAQKEFLREMKKIIAKNHFYIFLATHSIALFEWNYLDNVIVTWKDSKESNHTSAKNMLDFWCLDNKMDTFSRVKDTLTERIGLASASLILDLRCENNIFVEGISDFEIFQLMFEYYLNEKNDSTKEEKEEKWDFRFISFDGLVGMEKCDDLFKNKKNLFIFDSDEDGLNKKTKLINVGRLSEEQIILLNKRDENNKEIDVTIEDLFEKEDYQKISEEYVSSKPLNTALLSKPQKKYLGKYIIWALKEKKYDLISEKAKNNFSIIFSKILDFFNKEKINNVELVIDIEEVKKELEAKHIESVKNIQIKKEASKRSWIISGIIIETIIIGAVACLFIVI